MATDTGSILVPESSPTLPFLFLRPKSSKGRVVTRPQSALMRRSTIHAGHRCETVQHRRADRNLAIIRGRTRPTALQGSAKIRENCKEPTRRSRRGTFRSRHKTCQGLQILAHSSVDPAREAQSIFRRFSQPRNIEIPHHPLVPPKVLGET